VEVASARPTAPTETKPPVLAEEPEPARPNSRCSRCSRPG
jgi:hypothetical protein